MNRTIFLSIIALLFMALAGFVGDSAPCFVLIVSTSLAVVFVIWALFCAAAEKSVTAKTETKAELNKKIKELTSEIVSLTLEKATLAQSLEELRKEMREIENDKDFLELKELKSRNLDLENQLKCFVQNEKV